MKVLHVIPSFAPAWRYGGPVRTTYELCRELARSGVSVDVFTTNADGDADLPVPTGRTVLLDGISVRYFSVQPPRSYSLSLPLAEALSERVREYDVVHVHSAFNWPITPAAMYCRRYRVPYIVRPCGILDSQAVWNRYGTAGSSYATGLKKLLYFQLLERRNLEGASALQYSSLHEQVNSRWTRISAPNFICPLGVRAPDRRDGLMGRGALHLPADATVVLFLGRLHPIKGMDLLLPAYATLAAREEKLILAIAGAGTPDYESKLRELARRCGVDSRVRWYGSVEDDAKWSLLSVSDIFVLPSYHENFGVAAAEALAMGCPVLVSDQVGIHPEIDSWRAGLTVQCTIGDVERGLGHLVHARETRRAMGANGRALACTLFHWPTIAQRLIRIYENVIARRAPA